MGYEPNVSSAMAAAGSKPTEVAKDGTVAQLALENQPKGIPTSYGLEGHRERELSVKRRQRRTWPSALFVPRSYQTLEAKKYQWCLGQLWVGKIDQQKVQACNTC